MAEFKLPGEYIYDDIVMCETFPAHALDRLKLLELDDTDIIIATYPKSGTTWMQEILYMVHSEGDFTTADRIPLHERVPFIEMVMPDIKALDIICSTAPPRLIKTHMSAYFFDKTLSNRKTKFIVVLRNPKDTLVSYYHFYRMNGILGNFPGTWDQFFTLFEENRLCHGSVFDVNLSWWRLRDDERVLVLKYEDMLKDSEGAIRQVAAHVGKNLSPELIAKIVERTSFKSMRRNPSLNYLSLEVMKQEVSPFMRKREVGDWVSLFSKEQSDYVDRMCEKYFAPEGLFLEDGTS